MNHYWFPILEASLFAMLLTAVEHWFPWPLLMLKPLPRLWAYIMGMLAIAVPLTVLMLVRPSWPGFVYLWAFWSITAGAGFGTVVGYGIDKALEHRSRALEAEDREKALLKEISK